MFAELLYAGPEGKMVDFKDLNDLKTLLARGAISEEQFAQYQNLAARKILKDRKELAFRRNGFVFLLLAYMTGTLGLHNFYAGYYKRGMAQLFLTLISFYMYYIPLLVAAVWALGDFLFINRGANGARFRGSLAVLWLWRLAGLALLGFLFMSELRSPLNFDS